MSNSLNQLITRFSTYLRCDFAPQGTLGEQDLGIAAPEPEQEPRLSRSRPRSERFYTSSPLVLLLLLSSSCQAGYERDLPDLFFRDGCMRSDDLYVDSYSTRARDDEGDRSCP